MSAEQAALEDARSEIRAIAATFAEQAGPALRACLAGRLQALVDGRGAWFSTLSADARDAFGPAASRAIETGTEATSARLRVAELWLEPHTAPGVALLEPRWEWMAPEWINGLLRRFTRRATGPSLGPLHDPGNRIWVAVLSAAAPLDPVLREFGLEPSSAPALGGGHYGLAPATSAQLDPSGTLDRLWKRFRGAHERYVDALHAVASGR